MAMRGELGLTGVAAGLLAFASRKEAFSLPHLLSYSLFSPLAPTVCLLLLLPGLIWDVLCDPWTCDFTSGAHFLINRMRLLPCKEKTVGQSARHIVGA